MALSLSRKLEDEFWSLEYSLFEKLSVLVERLLLPAAYVSGLTSRDRVSRMFAGAVLNTSAACFVSL